MKVKILHAMGLPSPSKFGIKKEKWSFGVRKDDQFEKRDYEVDKEDDRQWQTEHLFPIQNRHH